MTDLVPLFPRQPVPPLNVNLAGGGLFDLRSERPKHFALLLFYRGLHCPICKSRLRELESKLDEFDKRGVAVVAVSSDSKQRAMQTRETWELSRLRIGYGLDLAAARSWGLFISSGRGMTSGRARALLRAGALSDTAGWHALLRQRPDDAVRTTAFLRHSCGSRLCLEEQLPGAR